MVLGRALVAMVGRTNDTELGYAKRPVAWTDEGVEMSDLRKAAQQALEALENESRSPRGYGYELSVYEMRETSAAITALRAALQDEGKQEPVAFDHGIGADRFKVVRGAFWWHVLVGESQAKHGKFGSRAGAEKLAADLLREFRNGAFVQHNAALPQQKPPQEPNMRHPKIQALIGANARLRIELSLVEQLLDDPNMETTASDMEYWDTLHDRLYAALTAAPPQRPLLTDDEICAAANSVRWSNQYHIDFGRAIERKVKGVEE